MKNFEHWARQLPLHPKAPDETWLWYRLVKEGDQEVLSWRCVACDSSVLASGKYARNRGLGGNEVVKICNLRSHHASPNHLKAVDDVFKLGADGVENCYTAPSLEMFKDLIQAYQKGGSMTAGFKLRSGDHGLE